MRIAKHRETVYCPRCGAGARMTWQDENGEYCMACRKDLKTGKEMAKRAPGASR
jgi:uncharacterized protein (DUF983 family)